MQYTHFNSRVKCVPDVPTCSVITLTHSVSHYIHSVSDGTSTLETWMRDGNPQMFLNYCSPVNVVGFLPAIIFIA